MRRDRSRRSPQAPGPAHKIGALALVPLTIEWVATLGTAKMYSPKDYWSNLAEGFQSMDRSGFAPILHPQAPPWFNRVIDSVQFRALRRALAIAAISPGARFLDVGCGTGRWVRRYTELGFSPVGVDATFGMLRIARSHQTSVPLLVGMAQSLPFSDSVFDCGHHRSATHLL